MKDRTTVVVEEGAAKVTHALGTGAKRAETRLLHDTADELETAARRHVENDAKMATKLESAAKRGEHVAPAHGSASTLTGSGRGTGGGAGNRNLVSEMDGASDLPNPSAPLSSKDHPYLRPSNATPEVEAIDGSMPKTRRRVVPAEDGRAEPPAGVRRTFRGDIKPFTLEKGKTYYRTVGDGTRPDGEFWSERPPVSEAQLRSDYAVLNDWNGDHGVVALTPSEDIPLGWEGRVGPQGASTPVHGVQDPNRYLPGDARQIWIPRGSLGAHSGHWQIAPLPQGDTP